MIKIVLILAIIMLLVSCADPIELTEQNGRERAGFWVGLWHGIIAPISFIASLFNSDIAVYENYNNGNWYVFGFLFGIGALTSTSSKSKRK